MNRSLIVIAAATVLLAGCSGEKHAPAHKDKPVPNAMAFSQKYASILTCGGWQDDRNYEGGDATLVFAASSAHCAEDDPKYASIVAVFPSKKARDQDIGVLTDDETFPTVVGVNWIYNGPDSAAIAKKTGGKLIKPQFSTS